MIPPKLQPKKERVHVSSAASPHLTQIVLASVSGGICWDDLRPTCSSDQILADLSSTSKLFTDVTVDERGELTLSMERKRVLRFGTAFLCHSVAGFFGPTEEISCFKQVRS